MIKNHPNIIAVMEKAEEFSENIENKFSNYLVRAVGDIEEANDKLPIIVRETTLDVGERGLESNGIKLTKETKDLIKKDREMKVRNISDKMELVELTKLV